MAYLLRNAHFIVIHVPIAMLLFSFVFDLLAAFLKKREWHAAGLLCLVVGTLGAIAAVATGPDGERNPLKPQHELFGKLTMLFFIVLTLVRLWMQFKKKREIGNHAGYLAAALIGAALVTYTGHLGGEMVHPDRQGGEFREGNFQRQFQPGTEGRRSGNNRQAPNGKQQNSTNQSDVD